MIKKVQVFALFFIICLSLFSSANAATQTASSNAMLIKSMEKVSTRAETLESEVKALKQQINQLKELQASQTTTVNTKPVALKAPAKHVGKANKSAKKLRGPHKRRRKQAITPLDPKHTLFFLGGTAVTTSPYLGVRSEFDGSDLIVNISTVNLDLRLLQQRQTLEQELRKIGKSMPDHPIIELSGKVEGSVQMGRPYVGRGVSDVNLASAELDVSAIINSWASAYFAFEYDNSAPAMPVTRRANSRIFLDEGFLTVGDLNKYPIYATVGQMNVPFGEYHSFMLSAPMTLLVGRTKARALLVGYHPKSHDGLYGSVFGFRGDAKTSAASATINQWGMNISYKNMRSWPLKSDFSVSYIANIADAAGMQATGSGSAFPGFGASAIAEVLAHKVPGLNFHGKFIYGPVVSLVEYSGAIRAFSPTNLMFYTVGAKPQALNIEGAYIFSVYGRPTNIAVGYGQTWQALGLNLPQHRYIAAINTSIWKDTLQTIEFRHDENYGTGASASGTSPTGGAPISTPGTALGKSSDLITAQVGLYF